MSFARRYSVAFTTDGSGDATVYSNEVNGRILSVVYDYGNAATGADITITAETTGQAILAVTNAGTSDARWMPRGATHDTAGAAETYDATEAVNDHIWIADERIKVVVAQGGDTKAGTLIFTVG